MKTVIQQEIERQEGIISEIKHLGMDRILPMTIANIEHSIENLRNLLPTAEQELKEAYEAGTNNVELCWEESGHPRTVVTMSSDDWFKNEYGEG